jgi:cytochrome oxidase assembly protein ShyY1
LSIAWRRWAPTLVAIAVIVLTGRLGAWQLDRAAQKDALQAQRDAAARVEPVVLVASITDPASLDGRRVAITGRFDAGHTVFLDNRTRQGVAGFFVVAPLRIDGGDAHVLVLRGWIPRDVADRTRLPALATPPGPVTLEGFAVAELPQPMVLGDRRVGAAERASRIWQHLDYGDYARWSGLRTWPLVVRQTSEMPDGLARDWVQPGSGSDRNRAYAFQWFAMAAVTAGLWAWFGFFSARRPAAGIVKRVGSGQAEASFAIRRWYQTAPIESVAIGW